jgi:adenine-specific DNA-methyltransferase
MTLIKNLMKENVMSKYNDLVKKLKEIFQIDRPELDFGIYRILNVKANDINNYLETTLKKKISDALATAGNANKEELEAKLEKIIKTYEELDEDAYEKPKVKDLQKQITAISQGANEHENSVFSHLLSFFSRYYDNGDFVSKRRFKGNIYAIPYAGEEVMLHWANKDQYYIKSGENFANYTFKLDDGRKVSFKLLSADTAKDNRKDNDADRRFKLIEHHTRTKFDDEGNEYEEEYLPVSVTNSGEKDELIIQFEYKAVKKGTKQEALIAEAVQAVLANERVQAEWLDINNCEPTETNPHRTSLERHLTKYSQRNTADYFIHKDLGGFLSNELDFYIKNEVMNLDNVQNAEVFADIEKHLRMIQCLRSIASDVRFSKEIME